MFTKNIHIPVKASVIHQLRILYINVTFDFEKLKLRKLQRKNGLKELH